LNFIGLFYHKPPDTQTMFTYLCQYSLFLGRRTPVSLRGAFLSDEAIFLGRRRLQLLLQFVQNRDIYGGFNFNDFRIKALDAA